MGLTYKPLIIEPPKEMKLLIKGTFDERNQKMINNKRKTIYFINSPLIYL